MCIAILGIGEVGSTLANDLLAANVQVSGWDPNPKTIPVGLRFADSNPDAVKDANLILSTNLAAVAVDVAKEVRSSLKSGQVYADMNTASPAIKQAIDRVLADSPALFVDVAIMAPIAPERICTPLIASGAGASKFADLYSQFGAPIAVLSEPAGQAATLKLVRSVFYKGLAAVVMETLEVAERLDIVPYAREQMLTVLKDEPMIDRFVNGSRKHARRRLHEMDAVIELLQSISVEAHSSVAARQRLTDLLEEEASK